jgi:SAM-dependent methyltransferase
MSNPEAGFDAFATSYDQDLARGLALSGESKDFFAAGRLARTAERLTALGVTPVEVLDFGCGTGSATPHLAASFPGARLTGVDTSEASLELARGAYPRGEVRFLSPEELPTSTRFDLVYTNGVFHHIPPAGRAEALAWIARHLAPGGVLALWENNPANPGTRLVMRRIPFDRDAVMLWPREARQRARAAGLAPLGTDFLFFFPNTLRLLRPLERHLLKLPLGAQYGLFARHRP